MPPVISTSGGAHGARSPAMTPVCETVFDTGSLAHSRTGSPALGLRRPEGLVGVADRFSHRRCAHREMLVHYGAVLSDLVALLRRCRFPRGSLGLRRLLRRGLPLGGGLAGGTRHDRRFDHLPL